MCERDWLFGSQIQDRQRNVDVAVTVTPIASSSPNRLTICFHSPESFPIWVGTAEDVAAGNGIYIPAITTPGLYDLEFNLKDHGDKVQKPWYGIAVGGTSSLSIFEGILPNFDRWVREWLQEADNPLQRIRSRVPISTS